MLAVVGAIALIAFNNLSANTTYYYTIKEFRSQQSEIGQNHIQVKGNTVNGSINYNATALDLQFTLEEGGQRLPVHYVGLKPDTLNDGIEVVAAGRVDDQGVFQAKQLLVKCPSRYIEKDKKANGATSNSAPANGTGR